MLVRLPIRHDIIDLNKSRLVENIKTVDFGFSTEKKQLCVCNMSVAPPDSKILQSKVLPVRLGELTTYWVFIYACWRRFIAALALESTTALA